MVEDFPVREMENNFVKRLYFAEEVKHIGMEEAIENFGIAREKAEEWWDWYKNEVPFTIVSYEGDEEWEELQARDGEAQDLKEMDFIVKGLKEVRFNGKVYSVEREGLYRFMIVPERVRNLIALQDGLSPIPLLKGLARLQIHGNRYNEESIPQLQQRLRDELWVSITCGRISELAAHILQEQGFPARLVGTMTLEQWNTYDNNHALMEVFHPGIKKWILTDVDMGCLFKQGDEFLSAYEFWQAVRDKKKPDFFPLSEKEIDPFFLGGSGFNYTLWARRQMGTPQARWLWYRRIFQTVGLREKDKEGKWGRYLFFGPEARLRDYFGSTVDILSENQWVETFYGESP